MVADAGRVVHVQVADTAVPAVGAAAVAMGVVHPAEEVVLRVVGDEELFADHVVGHVVGVVGIPLDLGAHDVRGGLVEPTRLAGVVQPGRATGHAVAHLVTRDIERGQRAPVAAAVTELHAEAAVAPEGVAVTAAVVHKAARRYAVVRDAVPAERVQVEVPRVRQTVCGVGARALTARGGTVAPDVVGVREHGARPLAARVVRVVDGLGATRLVGQRVVLLLLDVVERDGAGVERLASADILLVRVHAVCCRPSPRRPARGRFGWTHTSRRPGPRGTRRLRPARPGRTHGCRRRRPAGRLGFHPVADRLRRGRQRRRAGQCRADTRRQAGDALALAVRVVTGRSRCTRKSPFTNGSPR